MPLYYRRNGSDVPLEWAKRAAKAVASIAPQFNAARMVKEYVTRYYAPASRRGAVMQENGHAQARQLAAWSKHVSEAWPSVYFTAQPAEERVRRIGDEVELSAVLNLGELESAVRVELVYGPAEDALEQNLHTVELEKVEEYPDGGHLYRIRFRPGLSGRLAYGVRVYPVNELLTSPLEARAIRWA